LRYPDVSSDVKIADEQKFRMVGDLLEYGRDRLEFLMVRRDTVTDEAERHRQPVEHVDLKRNAGAQQGIRGIESSGSTPNDGNIENHESNAQRSLNIAPGTELDPPVA
jgi:hypothetical protein